MIPATINVFVKPRNDNITFIDIAMISLATNKTGRSMPLFLTFLHSLPAIMQGQNCVVNDTIGATFEIILVLKVSRSVCRIIMLKTVK